MEDKTYITPEEAAKYLGVKLITIYRYMKRKHNPLPYYPLTERNFRLKIEDIEAWMESRIVK